MRTVLLVLLLAVIPCARPAGAADTDGFARGNALYSDGKFAEAAAAYESEVQRGHYSANGFYNLANAYHRLGNRGRAILNYQRALLLEPTHAEAAANLAFVRGRTSAPVSPGSGGLAGWLDVDGWTWLAAAGGWLAVVGLGAAVFRRRSRGVTLLAGIAGAAVCAVAASALVLLDGGTKNPARAVVLADDTRALYAPADNSRVVLNLPAGGEVLVLSEQGAWAYVQLADGSRGWVSAELVAKVIPPPARTGAG